MEIAIILGTIWFTAILVWCVVGGREYRAQQRYKQCLKNIYDMETRMFVGSTSYDLYGLPRMRSRDLAVGELLPEELRWVQRKPVYGKKDVEYKYVSWPW